MKILNLFAGIGGNRLLWNDVLPDIDVTAVEFDPAIAEVYKFRFPADKVIVCDAFDYAADNYDKFDFIWASPPCQTHSRLGFVNNIRNDRKRKLPDFMLYSLISFFKTFCKNKFVVENVIPYYDPLIFPNAKLLRHLFWSNFYIPEKFFQKSCKSIENIVISDFKDFDLS
ncbi:DNA cytosine methyltransferase, partial [Campylobacter showae]